MRNMSEVISLERSEKKCDRGGQPIIKIYR